MGDSFAFLVEFRSSWRRACLERWALAHGIMLAWPVTPQWGLERACYLFA
jgi:hypothetical protein